MFITPTVIVVAVVVSSLCNIPFSASAAFDNITFNFSSIDPNNHQISYEGDGNPTSSSIQLTRSLISDPNLKNSTGRATYYQLMHLWDNSTGHTADFSAMFSFSIDPQNETLAPADGLAFFLSSEPALPFNSGGGFLGLVSASSSVSSYPQKSAFVAIEFDTYTNSWDPMNDTVSTHIGIDINSVESVKSIPWVWAPSNLSRNWRVQAQAFISYNSSSQKLSVVLRDSTDQTSPGYSSHVSYQVQLKDYLPEWVYFGFSAATGYSSELHTIYSWKFSSSLQVPDIGNGTNPDQNKNRTETPTKFSTTGKKRKAWLWGVLGFCGFLLLAATVPVMAWFCPRKREEDDDTAMIPIDEEFEKVAGPRKFSFLELAKACDNFAADRLLGEGGFGKVYEGYLSDLACHVAIKKITPNSSQGLKEYSAEVKAVSQLRHRSLVQLIGWCHAKKEFLLIYEFMSNGSLDSHLFRGKSLLTWETRYKIARDLASALLYLHEEWTQCVVHRDIKCSNIMLDSGFDAKLGDFGLARLVDHGKGSETTMLAGTMGYMAPECVYTGKASKESDVYSFGIVALEIDSGRKVIEPKREDGYDRLVDWVWNLYGLGKLMDAVDPKLDRNNDKTEMECLMVVGLWCAHPDYSHRPSIREALSVLNFEARPPILPPKMPLLTYAAPLPILSLVGSFSITRSTCGGSDTVETSTSTTMSFKLSTSPATALQLNTN